MKKFQPAERAALFFMHIPKTAGTSMRRFLADQYPAPNVCPATDWQSLLETGHEKLAAYRLVHGHFDISLLPSISPAAKTLTLLRNPLNRTLSAIRHMRRDPEFHPLHAQVRDMRLLEILQDPILFAQFRNAQTAALSGGRAPAEILDYLREGAALGERRDPADCKTEPDLAEAKENLARFDFIGIVEELPPLVAEICHEMGYHPPSFLRRDNAAPDGISDFAARSSRETELLMLCNNLDMQLYAFAKDLIAKRQAEFKPTSIHAVLHRLCDIGIYEVLEEPFCIDLAGPMPGSGWYEPEFHHAVARWTGPFNQFSLDLPLSGAVSFRARMQFHSPVKIPNGGLGVHANGVALSYRVSVHEDNYDLAFEIPPAVVQAAGNSCQIVVTLPGMYKPRLGGSADLRTLGVLVSSIAFEVI